MGARFLARPGARVVGIVGPGVMARTSLAAFVATCPGIDTVKVKGRGRASMVTFSALVAEQFPQITTVTKAGTIEEAVRESDIVTFCTTGMKGDPNQYPTVVREWVKPGAYLSMPCVCNIDEGMQKPDVRKVADNVKMYEAWANAGYPAHKKVSLLGCKFMDMIHDGVMSIIPQVSARIQHGVRKRRDQPARFG